MGAESMRRGLCELQILPVPSLTVESSVLVGMGTPNFGEGFLLSEGQAVGPVSE